MLSAISVLNMTPAVSTTISQATMVAVDNKDNNGGFGPRIFFLIILNLDIYMINMISEMIVIIHLKGGVTMTDYLPFQDFIEILNAIDADYDSAENKLVCRLADTVPNSIVHTVLKRADKVVNFDARCHDVDSYYEALSEMHRVAQIEVGIISKEMKLTYDQLLALRAAVVIQVGVRY